MTATTGWLRSKKAVICRGLPAHRARGVLRTRLTGAIHTQQRMARSKLVADDNPLCIYCGQAEEDQEHICVWCPRWEANRRQFWEVCTRQEVANWPPITRHCGVVMNKPEWVEQLHGQLREQVAPPIPGPLVPHDRQLEHWAGDHLLAATDGACRQAAIPVLRRAGFGIFLETVTRRTAMDLCRAPARQRSGPRSTLCGC